MRFAFLTLTIYDGFIIVTFRCNIWFTRICVRSTFFVNIRVMTGMTVRDELIVESFRDTKVTVTTEYRTAHIV